MLAEAEGCPQTLEGYLEYIREHYEKEVEEMQKYFPAAVIPGEGRVYSTVWREAAGK